MKKTMCTQYQLTIVFKTEFGGADILGLRRGYVNKRSESWEVYVVMIISCYKSTIWYFHREEKVLLWKTRQNTSLNFSFQKKLTWIEVDRWLLFIKISTILALTVNLSPSPPVSRAQGLWRQWSKQWI